jgi:FSR family fosmidomycin resistance protein-like MFS transporter
LSNLAPLPESPDPPQLSHEIKSPAFDTRQVVTISAGHAVHDTYTGFLAPLLPELITKFSLTKGEAGLLSAFTQFPSIFQPLIGYLADHLSLRYLVILAPAITASMMSALGIAPGYPYMALALLVAGLSSAGLHAVGPVMAGRVSGERLGRGMSFWMVGGELGRTLGPIIVVTAIGLLGLRGTPWLMLGGWLASVLLYFSLRDIPGRPDMRALALPWRDALRKMRPLLLPLALYQVVHASMNVALTTFLPTFLREGGTSLWLAGASLSILEAAGILGALAGGSLSDRHGRRRILAISMLINAALMFAFLRLDGFPQMMLLPLLGLISLARTPVMMALVQESYPQNRALANGVYMAMAFLVRSFIAVLFGGLSDLVGLESSYFGSAVLMLAGVLVIGLLPSKNGVESAV